MLIRNKQSATPALLPAPMSVATAADGDSIEIIRASNASTLLLNTGLAPESAPAPSALPLQPPPIDASLIAPVALSARTVEDAKTRLRALSDLQARELIVEIIRRQDKPEIPAAMRDIQALWDWEPGQIKSDDEKAALLQQTMQASYDYFAALQPPIVNKALLPNGPFAANMAGHIDEADLRGVMQLFCRYVALLSVRTASEQQHYFDSFPPKSEKDIACLPGTGARLSELLLILTTQEVDLPYLYAHETVLRQVIDKVKSFVPPGCEVHIRPYLMYILGVQTREEIEKIDRFYITPRFSIPVTALHQAVLYYNTELKLRLAQEVGEKLTTTLQEKMTAQVQTVEEILRGYSLEQLLNDHSVAGKKRRDNFIDEVGGHFFELLEQVPETDDFRWSSEKLEEVATHQLVAPWLANVHAGDEDVQSATPRTPIATTQLYERSIAPQLADLIQSDNIDDVQEGIETLWLLGEKIPGRGVVQFLDTLALLGSESLEAARARLPHHQQFKVDRIKECIDVIGADANIQAYFRGPVTLAKALYVNAYKNILWECINQDDLAQEFARETPEAQREMALNLVGRPDCLEIIAAIAAREADMTKQLFADTFLAAICSGNSELAAELLTAFTPFPLVVEAIKAKEGLLQYAAISSTPLAKRLLQLFDAHSLSASITDKLVRVAGMFGGDELIPELVRTAPAHYFTQRNKSFGKATASAAYRGDAAFITALAAAGVAPSELIRKSGWIFKNNAVRSAATGGWVNVFTALHAAGVPWEDLAGSPGLNSTLFWAAVRGHVSFVPALAEMGMPADAFNKTTIGNETPGFVAASFGRAEFIPALLDVGVPAMELNLPTPGKSYDSLLVRAQENNHANVVIEMLRGIEARGPNEYRSAGVSRFAADAADTHVLSSCETAHIIGLHIADALMVVFPKPSRRAQGQIDGVLNHEIAVALMFAYGFDTASMERDFGEKDSLEYDSNMLMMANALMRMLTIRASESPLRWLTHPKSFDLTPEFLSTLRSTLSQRERVQAMLVPTE